MCLRPEIYLKLSMDFSPIKHFRAFGLGKAGPKPELYRISYGHVSRMSAAAAEAILALSLEAFSPNIVRFIRLYVRTNLISLLCYSAPCFNSHSNFHSKRLPSRIDVGTEREDGLR